MSDMASTGDISGLLFANVKISWIMQRSALQCVLTTSSRNSL